MKVIHCVGWYFPDSVGGSEVYVARLSRDLKARGVDVVVAAPYDDPSGHGELKRYEHEGVPVVRYPVPIARSREQHEGEVPHAAFDCFERALDAERGDIFHLHTLSYGANSHHVHAARRRGMRAFLTVHTAVPMCIRGSMLRMGVEICDGRADPAQCVPCFAEYRGLPAPAAMLVGSGLCRLPRAVPRVPGRIGTLLATPAIVDSRADELRRLFRDCERVIAVCDWLRAALVANGAPAERVVSQRQGVDIAAPRVRTSRSQRALSIGYFGRAAEIKGIDVLIDAIRALPEALPVELRLVMTASGADELACLARIRELSRRDPRIRIGPPLAPADVPAAISEHDVIAVPSLVLETGPFVAMEALALGVPVLGSRLGGIAELVEHGVTGWLEPAGDVQRLSVRIAELVGDRAAVERAAEQASRVKLPRSEDVAEAMLGLYRSVR